LIAIDQLNPHPSHPRLVLSEKTIGAIEVQLRLHGFDPAHAIIVRPFNGAYQIVSGHIRTIAARRAGLTHIPAWVEEMTDDEAFMKLVLLNTQAEYSPEEHRRHALTLSQKYGKENAE